MVTEEDLRASVDVAFEVTGIGMVPWPDPHRDRSPLDVEYSRVTDPRKWRIIGARADAWVIALVEAGVANVERRTDVEWRAPPTTVISRTDRVMPRAAGALPLVVARSQLADIPDAGITLGAGDPAVCVAWFPECGCDACDSGSRDVLDDLDANVLGIVSGAFRRLSSRRGEITVIGDGGWSASNLPRRADVTRIIADPTGWTRLPADPGCAPTDWTLPTPSDVTPNDRWAGQRGVLYRQVGVTPAEHDLADGPAEGPFRAVLDSALTSGRDRGGTDELPTQPVHQLRRQRSLRPGVLRAGLRRHVDTPHLR